MFSKRAIITAMSNPQPRLEDQPLVGVLVERAGISQNDAQVERRQSQCSRSPPFSIQLLPERENKHSTDLNELLSLLPASYRTESGDVAATGRHVTACVDKELDLRRLSVIHAWLWVAGLPLPPRPLHHQLLLGREVVVTERMDMHLVWTTGRVFLKPIPRFLLDPRFWTEYLCCAPGCGCSLGTTRECELRGLRRRALGFLFSYAALISHESDFRIAQGKHLLPSELLWPAWRTFVEQLDTEHIHLSIDPRFHHGELRLSRLNKIYAISQSPLRGYMARWNQYGAFFHDNFAGLASAAVYIAIVLAAMQVGLATSPLAHNSTFQSASYGFAVFSVLGPPIVASLIVLAFCCVFVYNLFKALDFRKRRLARCVPSE